MKAAARVLWLLTALPPMATAAEPDVAIAEVPGWADGLTVEDFSRDRSSEFVQGIAHLLSDRQIRKTDDGYDFVERMAYRVVDRSGLEAAATITRYFDPEDTTLSFNFIRVVRDGQATDRLARQDITLLRQEHSLASGIMDGHYTAVVNLEDIRVGDIVDFSYSGSIKTPLWPDEYFETVQVAWTMPLARFRYRLSVPESLSVEVRKLSTDVEVTSERHEGWRSFEINIRDADPVPAELFVPGEWVSHGLVAFSTTDSWSSVADWAVRLVSVDTTLPDLFRDKLDEIAAEITDPASRAVTVLRLVQEEIRYLGLEIGLGSHVPRSPSETIATGYGDCKDKSVLLVSALNYLGIDAVPVLASLSAGRLLDQLPPMAGAFDHMIVSVDAGNETLWMDPTLSYQGGAAGSLAPLDYGKLLPIRKGQRQLIEPPVPVPDEPVLEISESFDFTGDDDEALAINVRQTYRQFAADAMRGNIAVSGREAIRQQLIDFYSGIYNGIQARGELAIDDDRTANVLVLEASYAIDANAVKENGYRQTLPVYTTAIQDVIPKSVEADRSAPLSLAYGYRGRHSFAVTTPGRRMSIPEDVAEKAGGIDYTHSFEGGGETFEMQLELAVTERTADLAAIPTVTALGQKVADATKLEIRLSAAVQTLAAQLGLDTGLDADIEETVSGLRESFQRLEFVEVLTGLNKLLKDFDGPPAVRGYLMQFKGAALLRLDRARAAVEAFDEGFELYSPREAVEYFVYIDALMKTDEARGVEVLERMLGRFPEAIDKFRVEWIGDLARHLDRKELDDEREAFLVAVAQALHQSEAKNLDSLRWVFDDAVAAASRNGDIAQATSLLEHIIDPMRIADLYANEDSKSLWPVIARNSGEDLREAVDRYIILSKAAAESSPGDFSRRRAHVEALRHTQDYDAAIEYAETAIGDWGRVEAVGEDAFWFVNEYAWLLSEAGRPDDADSAMSRLLELGTDNYGSLVSMAINQANIRLNWGRFEEALSAATALEKRERFPASDYGWMWVYYAKACALHQLDRSEEALEIMRTSMDPIATKNPAALTKTLLCMNDLDAAAELLVERLGDPETSDAAIRVFVDAADKTAGPPFLAELNRRAAKVTALPAVRNALAGVGRSIRVVGSQANWSSF